MTSPRPSSPVRTNGSVRDGYMKGKVMLLFLAAYFCVTDFVVGGDHSYSSWNDLFGRSLTEEDGVTASSTTSTTNSLQTLESSSSSSFRPSVVTGNWTETEIVQYMNHHPQRNYFSHLFVHGGYQRGIEIGVQDGRFSEIFLQQNAKRTTSKHHHHFEWVLVEPQPTKYLSRRIGWATQKGLWEQKGYLDNANCQVSLYKTISTDPVLLDSYPDGYFDFVYLDASHTYDAVTAELPLWWKKVRSGGILAGHDYCNYGEPGQSSCRGCREVPQCQDYTGWGIESAKAKSGRSSNQNGVVRAVQDWLVKQQEEESSPDGPPLTLRHTVEDFTRESLTKDGFDYDLVMRRDRNPSWYIYKP